MPDCPSPDASNWDPHPGIKDVGISQYYPFSPTNAVAALQKHTLAMVGRDSTDPTNLTKIIARTLHIVLGWTVNEGLQLIFGTDKLRFDGVNRVFGGGFAFRMFITVTKWTGSAATTTGIGGME